MTKLVFTYSWVYDKSIYDWLGKKWKEKYAQKGSKYAKEIQKRWGKINNKVFKQFETFGFKLPLFWRAYVVTCDKVIPFSDPLTLKISYNWDYIFTTLIHELSHIEFTYPANKKLKDKAFNSIKKSFPDEKPQTRTHISVNLLQLVVMAKVFPKKYQKMLAYQKSLPTLKRAWEIIEKNRENISCQNPINSILSLQP